MRGFGRAAWVGVAVASLVLAASGAGAAKVRVRTVKNVSLTPTGSLTYTWSGDPGRGCAAVGVCGIHGELILRPQTGGIVTPISAPIGVFLGQSGAARVVREVGGAVVGACVDVPGSSFELLNLNPSAHRPTTATIQSPPSSGRCAGPTSADLARVTIPVRPTGRSFDLTGTRSFAAGPFSGTLISTMRLVAAPASSPSQSFSSSSSGPGRPVRPAQAPIIELVQLQYRVAAGPGVMQTQFRGAPDPSCQVVDSCGTSGSLALSVQPSRRTLTVFAQRVVPRPLSRRQILNDVRRGKLSVSTFAVLAGHVSETLNWLGGSSCRDSVATPALLLNPGFPPRPTAGGRKVPVTLSANGAGPGSDVFRTHCPGPNDADLFGEPPNGQGQIYAYGSLATTQLLAKRSVLTLSEPGSFNGLGYVGNHTGSITLDLTLTKVTAHTQR